MLPFSTDFDANEWFVLLNSVFGYFWLFTVPKRYARSISTLVILFCVSIAIVLDHSIATPPLDMYDINDSKKYELMDLMTYFMYSPYALLAVYLYDKINPKGLYLTGYIIGWSLLATFFEWLAVKCHVFIYHDWQLLYSFSVYLVATTLQIWFFQYIRRYFHEHRKLPLEP